MGLFKFVKEAGASIFGGAGKEPDVTYPLSRQLADHGIDASQLRFQFDGTTIVATGTVPTQDQKEQAVVILGNIQGVEAVDDRIAVAAAQAPEAEAEGEARPPSAATPGGEPTPADWESDTYTVKRGDTLSGIAKSVYGDAGKYMQIFEANTPMLEDPDRIYPGQVLRIPPA